MARSGLSCVRWRSGRWLLGNQPGRWAVFAELLLELHVTTPADPFHVEPHLGHIPILVGVSAIRLPHDLERIESARGCLNDLDTGHRKGVIGLLLAARVFVDFAVVT